jgi:hypothetical protein
LQFKH